MCLLFDIILVLTMKSLKHYLLILAISTLPLVSLLTSLDMPHTHDGPVHLARMAAYFKAFVDGQILPRWAGDLNYGYGMPLFNFIYHTPYLISNLFLAVGLGLVATFKVVISVSFLLSGIFMLLFARNYFKNDKIALVVALFYQFAPFRLVELLVRGSFGELYTYTFFPLVLFGLTNRWYVFTAFATAALTISHNSISLLMFLASMGFILFTAKDRKSVFAGLAGLALGLLLSAFYWTPAVLEHKYTHGDLYMKNVFKDHFTQFWKLIMPNFTNDNALQTEGISVQIGIFHVLALISGASLIFKKKIYLYSILLTIISIFFMSSYSKFIWERISFLRQFQFPWRLLSIIAIGSSIAAASFRSRLALLTTFMVLSTAFYWSPPLGFDKNIDEAYYWNYPLNTTYYGETDVVWSAGPARAYPKERIEIIDGQGIIKDFVKKTTIHKFDIEAVSALRLADHTQYFPGWRAYVDNQKVPIEFQDQNWRGLITFNVPAGSHAIRVAFEKSKTQVVSEYVSLGTLITLGVLLLIKKW